MLDWIYGLAIRQIQVGSDSQYAARKLSKIDASTSFLARHLRVNHTPVGAVSHITNAHVAAGARHPAAITAVTKRLGARHAMTAMEQELGKQHATTLDEFNVVIVGNGAIGRALLDHVLKLPGLSGGIVLGRRPHSVPEDKRVSYLPFDAEDPQSLVNAVKQIEKSLQRVHLLINTVGMLHNDQHGPEKRLKAVDPSYMSKSFQINAVLVPLLAQAFSQLMRHDEPSVFASLSARVGSIEDNQLGGWYSYRASKAAHNMLLRTIAREWHISHRNVTVVALHPGTVYSRLSEPFLSARYKHRVLKPAECASALLAVIGELQWEDSGKFFDWQGKSIPW